MAASDIQQHLLKYADDTDELVEYLGSLKGKDREEAVQVTLNLLTYSDEKMRADAMWFLEILKPSIIQLAPVLLVAKGDSNLYVRSHAIVYLAENGYPDLLEELIVTLKNKKVDPQTRSRTALALGRLGNSEAISALIDCLDDGDTDVVWNIIHALGISRAPDAREILKRVYLTDKRTTPLGLSLSEEAAKFITV